MADSCIDIYYNYVLELVKDAGKVILDAKNITIELKDGEAWNLVTEYDRKVEEILIKKIKSKFPSHRYIGEEESAEKKDISTLTDEPTWIIDPIDGTANFVRNMPFSCVSVGLTIKKESVLGIVYNPFLDELFTAIKGKGAFLNGKRIYTSQQKDISKSVLNYELSLAREDSYRDIYITRLHYLMQVIQGIRSLGSAAIGMCYVALGITDAYQCDGLYPWDSAAGVVIVREAGGYVCDTSGSTFDLMNPNFIAASTKQLAEQYVAVMKTADEERMQRPKTNGYIGSV